jgi:hypothetical protein
LPQAGSLAAVSDSGRDLIVEFRWEQFATGAVAIPLRAAWVMVGVVDAGLTALMGF